MLGLTPTLYGRVGAAVGVDKNGSALVPSLSVGVDDVNKVRRAAGTGRVVMLLWRRTRIATGAASEETTKTSNISC